MGISFLIPLTLDSMPESTIQSVQNQQRFCVTGTDLNSSAVGISYEIITRWPMSPTCRGGH